MIRRGSTVGDDHRIVIDLKFKFKTMFTKVNYLVNIV